MLKKLIALLVALILVVTAFSSCTAEKQPAEGENESETAVIQGYKIAIITGSEQLEPELFLKAKELKEKYGDSIIVHSYADDYATNSTAVSSIADKIAADESVKAIIFANGVEGTSFAAKLVRTKRADIFMIVCNAVEYEQALLKEVNIVINLDFDKVADAMVRNAKEMGAETFVLYTFQRHADRSYVAAMRSKAAAVCEELKLTYDETFSVDPFDEGRSVETAKAYLSEDTARKLEEFGKNTALYATDPLIQEELIRVASKRGMIVAGTASMSPYYFAAATDTDISGHETDFRYMLATLSNYYAKSSDKNRVSSWEFSAPSIMFEAGFEYALRLCASGDEKIDTIAELNGIFTKLANGSPFELDMPEDGGGKSILLSSEFYRY